MSASKGRRQQDDSDDQVRGRGHRRETVGILMRSRSLQNSSTRSICPSNLLNLFVYSTGQSRLKVGPSCSQHDNHRTPGRATWLSRWKH
jgi:hypothetical protein